jgi:WD40 repeat protein
MPANDEQLECHINILFYSILTGSYDGVARVWNTDAEMLIDTTQCLGHAGQPIKCVAWLSDGWYNFYYFWRNFDNVTNSLFKTLSSI